MSDDLNLPVPEPSRPALVRGAALSTLSFEYDEIPLDELGDDDRSPVPDGDARSAR